MMNNAIPNQVQQWSTDFCDCSGSCLTACFCPCIQYGINMKLLSKSNCCCSCLMFACLCYYFRCCLGAEGRSDIREKYKIDGNYCVDCMSYIFCFSCALSQEYEELTRREKNKTAIPNLYMHPQQGNYMMMPTMPTPHGVMQPPQPVYFQNGMMQPPYQNIGMQQPMPTQHGNMQQQQMAYMQQATGLQQQIGGMPQLMFPQYGIPQQEMNMQQQPQPMPTHPGVMQQTVGMQQQTGMSQPIGNMGVQPAGPPISPQTEPNKL